MRRMWSPRLLSVPPLPLQAPAVANSALAPLHPIGPTVPADPFGSQRPPAKIDPAGLAGSKGSIGMQWGKKETRLRMGPCWGHS
jgi:hypothetical protein